MYENTNSEHTYNCRRNHPAFSGRHGKYPFFDIETTGLSPKNASIYLIGAAFLQDKKWTLQQWFAENTAEEEAILDAFLKFAAPYRKLVHFNGTTSMSPSYRQNAKNMAWIPHSRKWSKRTSTDRYRP